ncbi:TPA: DUF262 domain-containing protein [Aeromonas hydrophila]|nr:MULTISPECIES: DUF262 domain-containing protein [Aeromonas]HEB5045108.1 DUF262 domain-containing protein [Aeromonas hydrophila subsp. hydrophila]APJ13552.1 hypothetical protein BOQ57_00995 [Aeromonas hydrophila]MCK0185763.1 DUF262 domain-containing protein [Aeromonas hydrophila]UCM57454.1 DUF262 domain-containing protein [Aeromonas hydrophila]UOV91913.1 DUF262 domain-containing protein [Aeromonas hydrophila]
MNHEAQEFDDLFEDSDELEIEEQLENVSLASPFSTKDIKVNTQTIALSALIARLNYDEIDLQPTFQRKSGLWTNTQMSRLIESILLKMPLPIFYFDVSEPGRWLVVDGLQRLSAIKRFAVDNKRPLKLTNLEFLGELNGLTYADLPRPMQRVIDETQIVTYQIEPQTPKEVRYSIFNRINTGGLKLNSQEIRQALNQKGIAVKFLKDECESIDFKRVVNIRTDRMLDRELALRFFAFRLLKIDDNFKSLSSFLDRAMERIDENKYVSSELKILSDDFRRALRISEAIFGPNHKFSKAIIGDGKRNLNRSLFDVLTVCFSQIKDTEKFINNKDIFNQKLRDMLSDELSILSQAIFQGTSSKRAVTDRFSEMRKLIGEMEDIK